MSDHDVFGFIEQVRSTLAGFEVTSCGVAVEDEAFFHMMLFYLREALQFYSRYGPVYETTLLLNEEANEQVLAIDGLLEIVDICYPWHPVLGWTQRACAPQRDLGHRIHWVAPNTLWFKYKPFACSEARIRYRKRHTIALLDGALTTTAPPRDHRVIVNYTVCATLVALLPELVLGRRPLHELNLCLWTGVGALIRWLASWVAQAEQESQQQWPKALECCDP